MQQFSICIQESQNSFVVWEDTREHLALPSFGRSAFGIFGGFDVWKHSITLYVRARESFDGDPPTPYYRIFRLVTKGVPVHGDGQPLLNLQIHPSCHPMDLPLIQRQTDAEGLDYFEVPITFTEIGDE